MLHLVKYRKLFILFSMIIIVPGVIALILWGLNAGTDFLGGTNVVLVPQKSITNTAPLVAQLDSLGMKDVQVILGTNTGTTASSTAWIRMNNEPGATAITNTNTALTKKYPGITSTTSTITKDTSKPYTLLTITGFKTLPAVADIKTVLGTVSTSSTSSKTTTAADKLSINDVLVGNSNQVINILSRTTVNQTPVTNVQVVNLEDVQGIFLKNGGPYFQTSSITTVSGDVAGRTIEMSVLAVIAASVLILCYVWFSFRKVPKALRYGVCAITALLHDVLVVLGVFSILGHFLNVQVDSLFITALLTVIGFSVHDTIVVFDRIRENMQRSTTESFEDVVNASLIQTLARSLNTSLTVVFTMLALTLFTGESASVHTFTLALLIGIVSGTYSSIFNASMLLVIWEKGEWGFNRLQGKRDAMTVRSTHESRELASTR